MNELSSIVRQLWRRSTGALPQVAALGTAQAFAAFCGFGATVLWARTMPQADFGEYRLALSIVSIAGAFSLMGLGQVAIMSAAQAKDGNFAAIVRTKAIGNLVGSLFMFAAAIYYWRDGSIGLASALAAAAIVFPASNLSDVWNNWFNGKGWFGMLAKGRIAQGILPLLAIAIAIALAGDMNAVFLVLLVSMGGAALVNLLMLHFARRQLSNDERDTSLNAFGRHNTLALGFTALVPMDVLVLDHWHSTAEVAVYSMAVTIPLMLKGPLSIFGQFLAPRVYRAASMQDAWDGLRPTLLLLTLAFAAIGILGFAFLGEVMLLLFSDRYAAAVEPARWLWVVTCLVGSSTLLGIPLLATKKPFFVYGANVGYPLLLVSLFVALGSLGVIGLVIARIVAMIALAMFYCVGFLVVLSQERRLSADG